MLIKFHLILLWPLALLLTKRWRMFAGFSAMAAIEIAISPALGGEQGTHNYVALLTNKSLDRLSPSPELMISQQGLTENLNIHAPWAMAAILTIVIIVFAFGDPKNRRRGVSRSTWIAFRSPCRYRRIRCRAAAVASSR